MGHAVRGAYMMLCQMLGPASSATVEVPPNVSVTIGLPKLGLGLRYATLESAYARTLTMAHPKGVGGEGEQKAQVQLWINDTAVPTHTAVSTVGWGSSSTDSSSSMCVQTEDADFLYLCPVGGGAYNLSFEHVLSAVQQEHGELGVGMAQQEKQMSKWDADNTDFSFPVDLSLIHI